MEDRSNWIWFMIPSLIAVLSGMSVGSGGLLVIWLTELMGIGVATARGLNLFFFTVSAAVALIFHVKRRKLYPALIFRAAFFALCGTLVGALLGKSLDPWILKKLFGAFLVFSGIYSLRSGKDRKVNIKREKFSSDT